MTCPDAHPYSDSYSGACGQSCGSAHFRSTAYFLRLQPETAWALTDICLFKVLSRA
jgi:hypothetical protein